VPRLDVEVTLRSGVPALLPAPECRAVLESALRAAGAPADATVSLTLSDDDELAELNEEHMGMEGPTDVLSFPLLSPSAFPPHPGQDPVVRRGTGVGFALPPDERPHLGDIVISVERAVAQAEAGRGGHTSDVRWAPVDELRLLITHGALHLCGWDHADPEEAAAMRALETHLLDHRPGDPGDAQIIPE
jgi:probable rRNA maturation factor